MRWAKTWPEADADVAEAIDFAEFYAREMLRLSTPSAYVGPGRRTISVTFPWRGHRASALELPLAIMAGMTMAAIVVEIPWS